MLPVLISPLQVCAGLMWGHFACRAKRVRKILSTSSIKNQSKILDDMKVFNKWNSPQKDSCSLRASADRNVGLFGHRSQCMGGINDEKIARSAPWVEVDAQKSNVLLLNSLQDNGFSEIALGDIHACPAVLVSVLWRLLSDRHSDLRLVDGERENLARILHDNKVLSSRVSKLVSSNEKLQAQMKDLESAHLKKESELRARIESLEQNRSEWEKCAIAYKSRESKFVAEMRKQESQYEQLQARISRNRSVGPTSSIRNRVVFN